MVYNQLSTFQTASALYFVLRYEIWYRCLTLHYYLHLTLFVTLNNTISVFEIKSTKTPALPFYFLIKCLIAS